MDSEELDISEYYRHLFETYYTRLRVHARRFLDSDDDAADVVEDVFFELWQNRNRIDFSGNISGYLYQAVSTRSLNVLRGRGADSLRLDLLESIDSMRMEHLLTEADQSVDIEREEMRRQIDVAISELPDKCREAFKLSYIHGLRNRDIADAMGVSVRTVDAHIYKALRILREKLRYLFFLLFINTFF